MPNRDSFVALACETLAPLGDITSRAMFGGHALYCDGLVFALIGNNTLYLKANNETEKIFLAAGLEAFRPFPDKPETMRYHRAPDNFFDDPDVMRYWAGVALQAASAPKARKKSGRKA